MRSAKKPEFFAQKRVVSDFDRRKVYLQEKEEKRQKYSKCIQEINHQTEYDKHDIKRES